MFDKKLILASLVVVTAFAQQPSAAAVQTPQPKPATASPSEAVPEGGIPAWIRPETPEHRRTRLGTSEDPGTNPDSEKHWGRYGRSYTIERYERKWAAYDREDGWVRPMAMVNFAWEIYQQNDRYVWVWIPVDQPALHGTDANGAQLPPPSRYNDLEIAFFKKSQSQFTALTPAASSKKIRFEESSDGLPTQGS